MRVHMYVYAYGRGGGGETYACTNTCVDPCGYVRVNTAASVGKSHPKTPGRVPRRVINYRYGDDQPLIRITIIAIDSLARAPQLDLPETSGKDRAD